MLGRAKSNIYVSITAGEPADGDDGHYRKPHDAWFISVEPHKLHIPGIPQKHSPEPIHLNATKGDGSYAVNSHSVDTEPMIIGNILVVENAKSSPDDIRQLLQEKLVTGPSSLPSEQTSEDEPEHWIRKALHVLQEHGSVDRFDVGEFMTFAHAYVAKRRDHEGPAMVAYPKLNKDHEQKAKSRNFWVDYPMVSKVKPRDGIDSDSKKYGGLM